MSDPRNVNITEVQRIEKYDPLYGRFIRDMKPTDIWQIATNGSTSVTAAGALASTITDASSELYITGIGASGSSNGDEVCVTVGTSTILPTQLIANTPFAMVTGHDAPMFKVPVSTTVSIRALNAGTYTAFLFGRKEPILTKVETY